VHRMSRGRQLFEDRLDDRGETAHARELELVDIQLRLSGELAVNQQVSDLLELAAIGDIEDVVAAILQVVTAAPDRTQCGIAGGDAGQSDGFLRFRSRRGLGHSTLRNRFDDPGAGYSPRLLALVLRRLSEQFIEL